jgi:hypothetical protein
VNSKTPESTNHPDELLLLYVEDLLNPEDKTRVETHLSQCADCASRTEALKRTVSLLKGTRQVFCPEPWAIYEFVKSGKPEGTLSEHLALCDACREEAAAYQSSAPSERMPAEMWAAVRQRFSQRTATELDTRTTIGLAQRLRQWRRLPAMATAAAVVVVLVVLVLYPRDYAPPGVGLTSVTWEGVMQPKTLQKKAAVLILFKDFKQPVPQTRIDSMYRALKPDMDLSERFHVVSPAAVSAAIKKGQIHPEGEKLLLDGLRSQLDASLAVLVELTERGEAFDVKVNMVDTASGKTLRTATHQAVSSGKLDATVAQLVKDLLAQQT